MSILDTDKLSEHFPEQNLHDETVWKCFEKKNGSD